MANIKFSAFTQKVAQADVDFLVGYTGADNVRITPGALGEGIYLPLGGGTMTGVGGVVVPDNFKWNFGTGSDFYIDYDGTDATIENKDGDLYIINSAGAGITGKNIYFQSDGGAGSVATYFYLDGTTGSSGGYTIWPDDTRIALGDSSDFRMWFDGADMNMRNYKGSLLITNDQTDGDIIFRSDDGSGGITTYFQLNGFAVRTDVLQNFRVQDNIKFQAGSSGDLEIYHDGTDSYIDDSGTGDLRIRSNFLKIEKYTGETMATFNDDNAVNLYYDNSKKLETTSGGIQVTDEVSIGTSIIHTGDTDTKISFGTDEIVLTTAGADAVTVDSSQDATFAGKIIGQDSNSIQLELKRTSSGTDGNTSIKFVQPLGDGFLGVNLNGDLSFGTEANLVNNNKFKVDRSGNGTFAGRVSAGGASSPTGGAKLHVADGIGAGLEVIPSTTNDKVTLLSYDRNASTYQTLSLDASDFKFLISGTEKMSLASSTGNATFAGEVKADTHFTSSDTNVTLSTNSDGTVFLRPDGKGSTTAQSTFTTALASIGTNATFEGDIEVENSTDGLILESPDGTRYRVTVANGGTLSVAAV